MLIVPMLPVLLELPIALSHLFQCLLLQVLLKLLLSRFRYERFPTHSMTPTEFLVLLYQIFPELAEF